MTAVTGQTSGIVIEAERSRSYAESLGLTAGIRRGVMVALRCVFDSANRSRCRQWVPGSQRAVCKVAGRTVSQNGISSLNDDSRESSWPALSSAPQSMRYCSMIWS